MQSFDELIEVVRQIRAACPWDSVQTHESLKQYIVEETEEVLEGIDRLTEMQDGENLCEELGDVLFQIILHGLIAEEEGIFTLDDVIRGISDKMRFRHPRIFSEDNEELTKLSWEELKQQEKLQKRQNVRK